MTDDGTIERYIEERRQRVDAFVARHFTLTGTLARLRRTVLNDIVRYPINFLLSFPSLFAKQVADWLEMAGWDQGSRLLERIPLPLKTAAQAEVERAILHELLELDAGDPRRALLQDPFKSFRASRLAILDAVSSGLTLLVAYVVFGDSGLTPYAMGDKLARAQAKRDAASGFFLGSGAGSVFYSVFTPHPTAFQVFASTALVVVSLGALATLTHVFSDPLQRQMGVHRRQLLKLLGSFEDKMLSHARRGDVGPLAPKVAVLSRTVPELEAQPRPRREPLSTRLLALGRRSLAPLGTGYRRLEDRYGRGRALRAILVPAALVVILAAVIADRLRPDPYREVRALVAAEAFPTALARLDALAKQSSSGYQKQAEYWFWRGHALIGDRSYDAGADAYRTALRDVRYRDNELLIDDLVNAVAKTSNAKAKTLLLTETGPNALEPLIERTVAPEKIDRWALADVAERLGARERLDYEEIARVDLTLSTTCAEKKRAVQKIGEHHVTDLVDELRALEAQPQWKCLEPGLKNVISGLAAR